MKNGSTVIIQNVKNSGFFPNELPRSTAKSDLQPQKAFLCAWCSIHKVRHFEVLKHEQTVNADLYREQLDQVN